MKIIKSPKELQQECLQLRASGKTIAVVPTMGYLHAGHISLVDNARNRADILIVTIFVNPTQFGPNEDLDKYPRDFENDCRLCEASGADIIFSPEADGMYSANHSTWVMEEQLSLPLCGKSRPIHFRGVCTVVAKLFNLTQANVAVFGRKDAQQALIIRRMVRDLDMPIEIIVAPLVRDKDNVALSSRNRYLSEEERTGATSISRSLLQAEAELSGGGLAKVEAVKQDVVSLITAGGGVIDYVEALDAETLGEISNQTTGVLLAVAANFGKTRLIDNVLIEFNK